MKDFAGHHKRLVSSDKHFVRRPINFLKKKKRHQGMFSFKTRRSAGAARVESKEYMDKTD
jgi:hypothetical protein